MRRVVDEVLGGQEVDPHARTPYVPPGEGVVLTSQPVRRLLGPPTGFATVEDLLFGRTGRPVPASRIYVSGVVRHGLERVTRPCDVGKTSTFDFMTPGPEICRGEVWGDPDATMEELPRLPLRPARPVVLHRQELQPRIK